MVTDILDALDDFAKLHSAMEHVRDLAIVTPRWWIAVRGFGR